MGSFEACLSAAHFEGTAAHKYLLSALQICGIAVHVRTIPPYFIQSAMSSFRIVSPKRDASSRRGWRGFFPYYAGFSEHFATELLASANLNEGSVVWDPWNGSGTTTYAASSLGIDSTGYDINPVMVIVARARLLPVSEADSLLPIAKKILTAAVRSRAAIRLDDPLAQWFDDATASIVRNIDRAIRQHLIEGTNGDPNTDLAKMSGLAASMYVCLFSVCRAKLSSLRSSNPTWYRRKLSQTERISTSKHELRETFVQLVAAMRDELLQIGDLPFVDRGRVALSLADTAEKRVRQPAADFVLTSPPYCTRIDYAASTRIEIAVIGPWLGLDAVALSRAMIGTTRVPKVAPEPSKYWGQTCITFLEKVGDHPSKASRSYYLKNHLDYFYKMARSMSLVASGMKNDAVAAMVVQDSYYKDVHNPLPDILSEMGLSVGLRKFDQVDFDAARSMSGINTGSSAYREHKRPIESVLLFRKDC